jgi:hypothetical protein
MNLNDKVTIEVRRNKTTGTMEFSPLAINLRASQPHTTAISYEGEDRRWYADFTQAEKVLRDYKDGPGDDVRSAHWNNDTCEWEVAWWKSQPPAMRFDREREDFHVDG